MPLPPPPPSLLLKLAPLSVVSSSARGTLTHSLAHACSLVSSSEGTTTTLPAGKTAASYERSSYSTVEKFSRRANFASVFLPLLARVPTPPHARTPTSKPRERALSSVGVLDSSVRHIFHDSQYSKLNCASVEVIVECKTLRARFCQRPFVLVVPLHVILTSPRGGIAAAAPAERRSQERERDR